MSATSRARKAAQAPVFLEPDMSAGVQIPQKVFAFYGTTRAMLRKLLPGRGCRTIIEYRSLDGVVLIAVLAHNPPAHAIANMTAEQFVDDRARERQLKATAELLR